MNLSAQTSSLSCNNLVSKWLCLLQYLSSLFGVYLQTQCTSYDENVSYKHVNFCGVHWVCKYTPNREDRYCKRHKHLETKLLQERLDVCAENLNFLSRTCELCNEHDHFSTQCKLFHDRIVSKNCDDLISLAHHNELCFLFFM